MPFVKGQSGNPKGRPKKGRAVSDILVEIGNERVEGVTRLRRLLDRLHTDAENGDNQAARVILPYIQPEPKEQPDAGHDEAKPIKVLDLSDAEDNA